ncbi:MAG: hypothetical protein QOI62_2631 [Solirubrobacteraceae bacterium]|jgi:hypothetical protein|nr:hypothetical protein [Solirubrobacteraceae bacterium]MEA2396431.1 hypothetical protein [Solirubrobacteraceae bacterium]
MPRGGAEGAPPATPACPFCAAGDAELVSQFGSQIITSQWRCRGCGTYFEAVRDDFSDDDAGAGPAA